MSLASQMVSDASSVFLNTEDHAELVTHYPGGSGPGVSVTALVQLGEPQLQHESGGKGVRQPATLWVAASVTCTSRDAWTIRGLKYQASTVQPPDCGLQRVEVTRQETASRFRENGATL